MRTQKKKSGLKQVVFVFFIIYAAITLLPAGVYALGKIKSVKASSPDQAAASPAPEVSSSVSEPKLPGFLDQGVPGQGKTPEELSEKDVFSLYDHATGKTLSVPASRLIPAAIACEMDLSAPKEALKAQAVACYTLFSRKRAAGELIECDSSRWQVWASEEAMQTRWGEDYESNLGVLKEAAAEVAGELLQWEEQPILAAYFAISSGSTETSENVWGGSLPYLQAVASPGDQLSSGYRSTVSLTFQEFRDAASAYFTEEPPVFSGPENSWLTEVTYTPSGYVSSAVLGGKPVTGTELRGAFSLRSACFQVEQTEEGFRFTVRGWGHGVGMSQAGAIFLAKRGESYRDILSYYYPGTSLISQEANVPEAEDTE